MSKFDGALPAEPEEPHADLIARLRARGWSSPRGKNAALDQEIIAALEAADALSRPVTEEMVERLAVERFAQRHAGQYRPPVWKEALEHQRVIWRQCARHDLYIAFGMSKQEALRLTRGPKAIQEIEDAIAVVRRTSGHETYPGHDPAAGLPKPAIEKGGDANPNAPGHDNAKPRSPDTAGGAEPIHDDSTGKIINAPPVPPMDEAWRQAKIAALKDEISSAAKRAADREAAIRAEATAKERERCAGRVMDAYNEWWRLVNEHSERFAAWKRGGEEGPMPDSRLGSLPDYIAAAIRGGSHD